MTDTQKIMGIFALVVCAMMFIDAYNDVKKTRERAKNAKK